MTPSTSAKKEAQKASSPQPEKNVAQKAVKPPAATPSSPVQLAVVRLRGEVPANQEIRDTLRILGLRRVNSCVVMDNTPSVTGMLQKTYSFVTWGPVSGQTLQLLKAKRGEQKMYRLSPATLRSKKAPFPRGDLGFRGEKINELIQEMA